MDDNMSVTLKHLGVTRTLTLTADSSPLDREYILEWFYSEAMPEFGFPNPPDDSHPPALKPMDATE